ncbi:MAG: hypothetical protein LBC48_01905 [Dysgonamonadaceae bacterium]|jgi:hypothetical protein|nr:hypothetical protein [Dysgonamonadaceae bacterium]
MKQLILIITICALAVVKANAQFETSTASSPQWYFIQVKGTGDNAGKVVTEVNGQAVGLPVETGLAAKAKQLWRIELVPNSSPTRYEIINKYSGNKLDIRYDAELGERIAIVSETPFTVWTIQVSSGNYYYLRVATQPEGGVSGAGYLTQSGTSLNSVLYFTKSYTVADAQFQFVSIDAPIVSEDGETAWFSIHNAKSSLEEQCLTEVETPATTGVQLTIQLAMQDFTAGNLRQQWKIVPIPASGGAVNFVNRQTGHVISTTPVYDIYDYACYADQETTGWTIGELGNDQYEVRTGTADGEKYWYAATNGESSGNYRKGASLNTGFAWKFQFRDEETFTAIDTPEPEYDDNRIVVRNKRIYVESAGPYRIYTIHGIRVNENRELPAGIYLVTIKNQTTKVLVR